LGESTALTQAPGSSAGEPAASVDTVPSVAVDTSETPVSLVADQLSYHAEDGSYEAKGAVELRQADVELKADELFWQSTTQDVAAQGHVELTDAGAQTSAEHMQYNMATGQGQVYNGRVFVREGNFHLSGTDIEKHGQTDYLVKNGSFTTCDGAIPDWKFSAGEVDVTLGGYAEAKHVLFYIKDVPVLYVPYLAFPVKTERESGFLAPWFGYSKNKGMLTSLAWYQVIDRHMDATFYLDHLSKIGLGTGLEYRYALAGQNNGEAVYYHVTGFDEEPDYNYLKWEHRGNLPGGWTLTSDIEYADQELFFDEFAVVAEEYNRDKTLSTLMLQKNWQKLNLVGYARYLKDLEVADNDTTLQRLPELGLGQARYRLGETPLYLGLESFATRFWREEGETGERLYLRPFLSASLTPGTWLEVTPEIALNERLYHADQQDDEQFIPEFSLTLATRLVRDYAPNRFGIANLLHSVEPKVIYTYIPEEDQDGLPLFDLYDRMGKRNDVTYALVNRLTTHAFTEDGIRRARDFLYLRLSQRYNIDEARNNVSGNDRPFSPLKLELDFWPTDEVTLNAKSLIPVHGETRFETLTVGAYVKDRFDNTYNINYAYQEEQTDYLSVQVDTPLMQPVYMRYRQRYDFRQERKLEDFVGVEYRAKCWSLFVTYRSRYQEDEDDDREVMVNFVLAGLGENKGFGDGFVAMR